MKWEKYFIYCGDKYCKFLVNKFINKSIVFLWIKLKIFIIRYKIRFKYMEGYIVFLEEKGEKK